MDEFPRDAAEIDKLAADLADWQNPKGVYGPAPISALTQIENELNRSRRKEWDGLSRDSRRAGRDKQGVGDGKSGRSTAHHPGRKIGLRA